MSAIPANNIRQDGEVKSSTSPSPKRCTRLPTMPPISEPQLDSYISPRARLPLTMYEHRAKSQGQFDAGALDIVAIYLFDGSKWEFPKSFFSYTMDKTAKGIRRIWLDDLKLLPGFISGYRTLCFGFDLSARQQKRVDYSTAADELISYLNKSCSVNGEAPSFVLIAHGYGCRIADRIFDARPHFSSSCIGILYCQEPERGSDPLCGQILDDPFYKQIESKMRLKLGTLQMCLSWEPGWRTCPGTKLANNKSDHDPISPKAFDVFEFMTKPVVASLDWLFSPSITVEAIQSPGMLKAPVTSEPLSSTLSFGFKDSSDQYLQMTLRFIHRVCETENLFQRVKAGSVAQVKELIKTGVGLNSSKNDAGMTALHVAVCSISDEPACGNMIEVLCEQGRIAIDIKDCAGRPALHYAIHHGRPEAVVRKSLQYGAGVHILHHTGKPPLAMAEAKHKASIMTLMRHNATE